MSAPETVIVKYNAGNVTSVLHALERLGVQATVTDEAREIERAERVIFPGVGEASTAMAYLRERGLDKVIVSLSQPVLGICLGLQLMCHSSEEGEAECLGIFPQRVRRFETAELKVPQIGWNDIYGLRSPLFAGLAEHSFVYFVHGYYAEAGADTIATADYPSAYSAALGRDNFYAVQFHPERSGAVGHRILENFIYHT
jgi:glutamine amidotransferase